jgi:hypothetical protein
VLTLRWVGGLDTTFVILHRILKNGAHKEINNEMELFQIDDAQRLFISPEIDDWQPITERQISVIIDLDGDIDIGVPTVPNQLMYIYFPFAMAICRICTSPRLGSARQPGARAKHSFALRLGLQSFSFIAGVILASRHGRRQRRTAFAGATAGRALQ